MAAGIMGAIALATAQVITDQNRELNKSRIKSEAIDLELELRRLIGDEAKCIYNLNDLNSTNVISGLASGNSNISLSNGIKDGVDGSALNFVSIGKDNHRLQGANVTEIKLANFTGSAGSFTADLIVHYEYLNFTYRPLKVSQFHIVTDNPVTAVSGCALGGTTSGVDYCSSGQIWNGGECELICPDEFFYYNTVSNTCVRTWSYTVNSSSTQFTQCYHCGTSYGSWRNCHTDATCGDSWAIKNKCRTLYGPLPNICP